MTLTLSDTKVLLRYLERDRKAIVTDGDVIKFIDGALEAEGARLVTQVDHGVLDMKLAVDRLQDQIDDIHRQIEECVTYFFRPFLLIATMDPLVEQQKSQNSYAANAKRWPCRIYGPANN